MRIYRLRRRRNRRNGATEYAIGVPQGMGDHFAPGQRFEVAQTMTGQLVFTPVRELQPPLATS